MDGYKFVYRLATMLKVDNNAFIVPIYSQDYDRVVGVYPVLPQSARVIEYQGRPYLRYQLGGGNWAAIEFEDVGILNQYQYKNDFFGETNRALNPTMQLLNAQNQGIIEGIKQSATIRFLAKIAQPLRPEDVDKERQRFIKANLGTDNNGGVMLVDTKYADVKQGKGKKVNEGAANDDFKDTKVAVELTGNDFSATCTLSYAAATMSIDALEAFIVQDMADQVGNAMAADLMTTIKGAINAANKLTAATDLQVGSKPNTWYGVLQELGDEFHGARKTKAGGFFSFTARQPKRAILTTTVREHIDEIRLIEGQYLSAVEDENRALGLIDEGELKDNGSSGEE